MRPGFLHDIIFEQVLDGDACLGAIRKRLGMTRAPGSLLTFIVKHVVHMVELRPYSAQLMAAWLVILGGLLKCHVPAITVASLGECLDSRKKN